MNDLKVLVVDDESRMRKLVRDFLVKDGYSVVEVRTVKKRSMYLCRTRTSH